MLESLGQESLCVHAGEDVNTPTVLSFIDPTGEQPTLEEFKADCATRMHGPAVSINPQERWFNVAIRLKATPCPLIGRLEATGYGEYGELAYLLGEAWWGRISLRVHALVA
jgi:hypothetical protein